MEGEGRLRATAAVTVRAYISGGGGREGGGSAGGGSELIPEVMDA